MESASLKVTLAVMLRHPTAHTLESAKNTVANSTTKSKKFGVNSRENVKTNVIAVITDYQPASA